MRYCSMSTHEETLLANHKGDYTIYYQEGTKVEKINNCKIIKLDEMGITFKDKNKMSKDRYMYIPTFKLVRIVQEFF